MKKHKSIIHEKKVDEWRSPSAHPWEEGRWMKIHKYHPWEVGWWMKKSRFVHEKNGVDERKSPSVIHEKKGVDEWRGSGDERGNFIGFIMARDNCANLRHWSAGRGCTQVDLNRWGSVSKKNLVVLMRTLPVQKCACPSLPRRISSCFCTDSDAVLDLFWFLVGIRGSCIWILYLLEDLTIFKLENLWWEPVRVWL